MEPFWFVGVAIMALCAGGAIVFLLTRNSLMGGGDGLARELANTRHARNDTADRLFASQAELTGRLAQLAEGQAAHQAQIAEMMRVQEREVSRKLEDRLAEVTHKMGEGLEKSRDQQQTSLGELKERLAIIDTAQKNITELSSQVVSLQDILSNKQSRGAFGEIQLADLVRNILPPNAYEFQATLADNRRVDCLLHLPNPPGAIAIDAKFPLENFHALNAAKDDAASALARKALASDVQKHVRDIAEKYIVPGETAESALMFLPSEAIYAELHANLPAVVEYSWKARVWIVSPTTLMATLNTVRAILKDSRMRDQAHVIQKEVGLLLSDVNRLDSRVGKLETHFRQADENIRQVRISAEKITRRGDRIQEIEVGADETVEAATPPTLPPKSVEPTSGLSATNVEPIRVG
jgi:DNA recombination protein RmuC